jgi:hypothetical protein
MARPLKDTMAAAAKILGRKGGKRGGPARAEKLTKAQRVEIARKGGEALQKKKHSGG